MRRILNDDFFFSAPQLKRGPLGRPTSSMHFRLIPTVGALVTVCACLGPGPDFSDLKAYQMPSASMEPTLLVGDYLIAGPLQGSPMRGQVVIYQSVYGAYVHRVVGIPGDTLAMQGGQLVVNAQPVPEPYARHEGEGEVFDTAFFWQRGFLASSRERARYRPSLRTWGPIVIPTNRYFFLGDNRGASADSRFRGLVADTALLGEPLLIYFSRDRASGKIRWRRIGTILRRPA